MVIGTSFWVWLDARSIGVKRGQIKGFFDLPPWGWFWGCLLLWIIAFPGYLVKRPELQRVNRKSRTFSPPRIPPSAVANQADLDQELRKLAKLKEDGIITDDEFSRKKKALLGI